MAYISIFFVFCVNETPYRVSVLAFDNNDSVRSKNANQEMMTPKVHYFIQKYNRGWSEAIDLLSISA